MKILHLSHGDSIGGAARFSLRTHFSLLSAGIDSEMWVSSKSLEDSKILVIGSIQEKGLPRIRAKLAQQTDRLICNLERNRVPKHKSPGWVGALNSKKINESDSDIVHAHWINGGLVSIRQLGKIKKPLVWSMLDFWPVMGAEHYSSINPNSRWIKGFEVVQRDKSDFGLDICAISAYLKKKYWGQINAVVPGKWMLNEMKKSSLFPDLNPTVIPPALDTNLYYPVEKRIAREELDISPTVFVIGYGGGISGRKGWDIFKIIASQEIASHTQIEFLVFGSDFSPKDIRSRYPIKQLGKIRREEDLRIAYSCMDLLIMPSKMDTYGLIAQEAQSCGVPVICFENTGVADVIVNQNTGLTAENGSVKAILNAVESLIINPDRLKRMSENARKRATDYWGYDIVSRMYTELYMKVLDFQKRA